VLSKKKFLILIAVFLVIFVSLSFSICLNAGTSNSKIVGATSDYKLVWNDEFDGTSLNQSNWAYDIGGSGWGNNELEYYTNSENNCKVSNGMLTIAALKESKEGKNYTSARIKTQGKRDWTYGKIESRIKIPTGQGVWPAFWMLGSNISTKSWPGCGEIDIMEHVNNNNDIVGTMHWDLNGHQSYGKSTSFDANQFHNYSIEWDSNSIKWYLDGKLYNEGNIKDNINGTEEFHKPFFIILNLAIGGNWPGSPNDSTIFPAKMQVDYVRAYQKTDTAVSPSVKPSTSKEPVSPSSVPSTSPSKVNNSIYSVPVNSIPNSGSKDLMSLKVLNGSNGKFADNNVYWAVLGINPANKKWSYLDLDGNLIPISKSLNDAPGHLNKNNENYANIYHTIADKSWPKLPKITSGRMYLSMGSPCYIKTYDDGFAGPNVDNKTDPNKDVYFDFVEFTIDNAGYHGNTTRVDGFGFPIQHRLINKSGSYDKTVGELESEKRSGIFSKYQNSVPTEFKSLAKIQEPYRIVSPMHGSFSKNGENANYFSSYSNISTQDIFMGVGGAANPQVCADINRHVFEDKSKQNNPSCYYKGSPANYYAKFWHDISINKLAYGFCYDDVNQQAAYLETIDPNALIIRAGW